MVGFEDFFAGAFLEKIEEALAGLKPLGQTRSNLYSSVWCGFSGVDSAGRFAVADGSCASTSFRGGVRVVVARAASLVYEGWRLINSIHDLDVKVGFRLRRASLYMRALEFRCLARALNGVCLAICDGHIYPTIHPAIYMRPSQVVKAYYEYLSSLLSLYREAWRLNVTLVGLAKDSAINYVRARLIAQSISEEHREAAAALARERSPSGILKALRKMGMSSSLIDELEAFTSDEEAFDEYVKEPGFSTPLALAPQPIFFKEVSAGVRWWDASIRKNLMKKGGTLRKIAEVLDGFYEMPPTTTFYWRPWHGVGTYRVDVSGWSLGLSHPCGDMDCDYFVSGEAVERCRKIVAALNALSPEPYAVKPLADVDLVVRLDRQMYREFYEPQVIEAMRRAGFKAQLTKRRLREIAFVE